MSFPDRTWLPFVGVLVLLSNAGCGDGDSTVSPNTSNAATTEPQSPSACLQGCVLKSMTCTTTRTSSKASTEQQILAVRPSPLGCELDVAHGDGDNDTVTFEVDCLSNRVCFGYDGAVRECVPATIGPTSVAYDMIEDGESIACGSR